MTRLTIALLERLMHNRIEEAFIDASVGIMTTQTGGGRRLDSLMQCCKTAFLDIMTIPAQVLRGNSQYSTVVRTMGLVTGAAVLQDRLMGKTLIPEAACFLMTGETEGRGGLFQKFFLHRTMGIVTGGTFLFLHRFMFDRIICFFMTFLTEGTAYILQQTPEIT